ncbi:MAG: Rv0361 family membrane protein [Mycobacterium sp.]
MAGPYPPQYGPGPVGPPPPHPGPPSPPPQPYPENPVAPPLYPGMLPPPIPYPKRSRWRGVLAAVAALAVVAAAVAATVFVMRNDDGAPSAKLTTASAQAAIQNYLDALQRGDVETIARHTLCGLFDAVKDKKSDLALADLSSDAFRKQFNTADVTSIDKMVFSSPYQAQVLFTMRVTPAGTRTQPPPKVQEQAVAQVLSQGNDVLVCSYLLRAGGQY